MPEQKKKGSDDESKPKIVIQRYRNRLSILKKAQAYSAKDNIPRSVEYYLAYLDALAQYLEVEPERLSPNLFDPKKDAAEMMLLSQVYWDLAKAYDRNPKLTEKAQFFLDKFVKFTIGFKYQYLNSELIRKFLRKKQTYNPKMFEKAYKEIRANTKKCYIATYCFGKGSPHLANLRSFKNSMIQNQLGDFLVERYYRFSPPLINFLEKHPIVGYFLKKLIRPILISFSKIIEKTIL